MKLRECAHDHRSIRTHVYVAEGHDFHNKVCYCHWARHPKPRERTLCSSCNGPTAPSTLKKPAAPIERSRRKLGKLIKRGKSRSGQASNVDRKKRSEEGAQRFATHAKRCPWCASENVRLDRSSAVGGSRNLCATCHGPVPATTERYRPSRANGCMNPCCADTKR